MEPRTRREFLYRSLMIGAGVAGWAAVSPELLRAAWQGKTGGRSYAASNLYLELDGMKAGFIPLSGLDTQTGSAPQPTAVRQVGAIVAPTASRAIGLAPAIAPTAPQTAQVTFCFGTGLSNGFYSWLQQSLANQAPRNNGTLYFIDSGLSAGMSLEWTGGSISEFDFPALDATQRAGAVLTLTVKAVSLIEKNLTPRAQVSGGYPSIQKKMLTSNFRLSSSAYQDRLNYVRSVDAIGFVPATRAGNFSFLLPMTKADLFYQALQATSGQPQSSPPVGIQRAVTAIPQAPSIQIDLLSENLQQALLSVVLQNCAVKSIESLPTGNRDAILLARVKMSYQNYQLQFGNTIWA